MSRRVDRINGLLRQELSQLLSREVKDPRLGGVVCITEVETSNDLRNARVYLSVMGDKETKHNALTGIESAASFLRRELKHRLALRYVPFLKFELDDSIENADHLFQIMDRIKDTTSDDANMTQESQYQGPLAFPDRSG